MFFMNNDMSLADMKILFSMAKGFDAATFDSQGRKTLVQLNEQIRSKDLTAVVLSRDAKAATLDMERLHDYALRKSRAKKVVVEDPVTSPVTEEQAGRLLLVRMTVKIHVEFEELELLETMRMYTGQAGGKQPVIEKKDCANTETRQRVAGAEHRESVLTCASRAMKEENGLIVTREDFVELTNHEIIGDIHPSSVYPSKMVLSQQIYQAVRLILPQQLWKDGRSYVDDGVEIHQQWFPIQKRKEYS